jgi:hypothetical protein
MKISQLVENKKPYHESVASRLPRGIQTQQQLLNLGYRVAVKDLGLAKAKTLDENFAAKLVNSYHRQCLEEGVGSFLGKLGGHVVGAAGAAGRKIAGAATAAGNSLKGAWNDAKQGYADAKGSWDPTAGSTGGAASSGTAPAASGSGAAPAASGGTAAPAASGSSAAPAASGGTAAPAASGSGAAPAGDGADGGSGGATPPASTPPKAGGGVGDIMKAIDQLDPASKKQLAGELDKSIKAAPAAAGAEDPNSGTKTDTTNAGDWAADGRDASAADHATPADVKPASGATPPADELDDIKKNAGLPAGATPPAAGTTPPAGTAPKPATPNFGGAQGQASAPSKVSYSGMPKPKPLPQATPAQGAYSVKSAYGAAPKPAAAPAAPQFKGPKVNGLQVRNMGEGKKLKFRSNFLGIDI